MQDRLVGGGQKIISAILFHSNVNAKLEYCQLSKRLMSLLTLTLIFTNSIQLIHVFGKLFSSCDAAFCTKNIVTFPKYLIDSVKKRV